MGMEDWSADGWAVEWVPSPEAIQPMVSLIIAGASALLLHFIQEMDKIICKAIWCNLFSSDLS